MNLGFGRAILAVLDAETIIGQLKMQPHPEGGHFVESFRDDHSTAIYFLLQAGERSHWHRVKGSVEIWHFHSGAPLSLQLSEDGEVTRQQILGCALEEGQRPQLVVPSGAWQMAESLGDWTLVSCTVAPAFEFANFELAPADWHPSHGSAKSPET